MASALSKVDDGGGDAADTAGRETGGTQAPGLDLGGGPDLGGLGFGVGRETPMLMST